jgi:hypothetical protein
MGLPHVVRLILVASFFIPYPPAHASETIVVAEGRYVMGDSDTLAMAEERVLRLAQRRAVEEAGLYPDYILSPYSTIPKKLRLARASSPAHWKSVLLLPR